MVFADSNRLLSLVLMCAASSCAPDADEPVAPKGRWTAPLAEREKDPFPREFINRKGERYAIAKPAQRVASATLFTDVVLLAICPENRIAALHEVSEKPLFSPVAAESKAFPRHVTPDPESVLAVRPDLVFLAGFSDKRMQRLVSGTDRVVIRLHQFSSIPGVQDSIRAVGYILGLDREAENLVCGMQVRLDAVAQRGAKRKRWRLLSWSDGFTAGKGTIFDDVLGYVGATNIAKENGFEGAQRINPERLLAMKPDALVIGVLPGKEDDARNKLMRLPALRSLAAVQRDRIVFVPNHLLLATSHHVAGAAEVIAATLDRWGKP